MPNNLCILRYCYMRLLRFNDAQLHTAILFMQSILQMSAKQLHGIFHLRTSAAGTINPTLCPHLPPTLGVSHPPHTQAGIGGQPLWSSPMSGAVKIWQILWIRCDKYYCWPAAKNSWCVPRFRQMMIHFHHFPWCGAIFWVECFFEEMFWHLLAGVRRLVGEWWLL